MLICQFLERPAGQCIITIGKAASRLNQHRAIAKLWADFVSTLENLTARIFEQFSCASEIAQGDKCIGEFQSRSETIIPGRNSGPGLIQNGHRVLCESLIGQRRRATKQ